MVASRLVGAMFSEIKTRVSKIHKQHHSGVKEVGGTDRHSSCFLCVCFDFWGTLGYLTTCLGYLTTYLEYLTYFRFTDTYDLSDQPQMKMERHQRMLNRFYNSLANLTREVVLIQERTPVFSLTPIRAVLSKLKNGLPIVNIGEAKVVGVL